MNKCSVCNSLDTFVVKTLAGETLESFSEYSKKYYDGYLESMLDNVKTSLCRCNNCRHFFYSELPSETKIKQMYEIHASRYKESSSRQSAVQKKYKNNILQSIKKIMPHAKTFLDFGAGNCLWSDTAADYFKVTAYDEHISRMNNSTKYSLVNEFADLKTKKFDVIFCNQVLEHLIDPDDVMNKILNMCHSETLVYISVPNTQRANYKNFVDDWPYDGKVNHLMAPFQHLQGYSQKSLRILSENNNFKKLDFKKYFNFSLIEFIRSKFGEDFDLISTTSILLRKKKI